MTEEIVVFWSKLGLVWLALYLVAVTLENIRLKRKLHRILSEQKQQACSIEEQTKQKAK